MAVFSRLGFINSLKIKAAAKRFDDIVHGISENETKEILR
jgi:hypothetical protein